MEAPSEGGHVVMPMADASRGPCFGTSADRFGIDWMIDHRSAEGAMSPAATLLRGGQEIIDEPPPPSETLTRSLWTRVSIRAMVS